MQIAHASQDVHYASWDEAARHTVFAHLSVDNSITGFTLTETMLFYDDQSDKATKAVLLFTNEQDERYRISIRVIGEREVTATSLFGSASKSEKIRLANGDGWLTVMEDGRTMLDYVSESFHISISGQLDESEIVEVANAIHS